VNACLRNSNCSHVNGGTWMCVWTLPRKQHRSVLQNNILASDEDWIWPPRHLLLRLPHNHLLFLTLHMQYGDENVFLCLLILFFPESKSLRILCGLPRHLILTAKLFLVLTALLCVMHNMSVICSFLHLFTIHPFVCSVPGTVVK
jgi:hypothetical protein